MRRKILSVEDSKLHREMLRKALGDTYEILEANNGQEGIERLRTAENAIDAIVLDIVMPVMDGFQFMEIVGKDPELSLIPVLVTTDSGDLTVSEKRMLELGVWDFISKPYNKELLELRIKNAIDKRQFTTLQRIRRLEEYDALTGLLCKKKLFDKIDQMREQNPQRKFTCVRFDVDRFQLINSFFGHEEGDRLLCYIADSLRKMEDLFQFYIYGRMEADYFGFCIETSPSMLEGIIHGLKDQVAAFNRSYNLMLSFGIYVIDNADLPANEVFDRAALAARRCKGDYKAFYAFYDEKMRDALVFEQEVVNEMSDAISGGQIEIYLQPIVDLATEKPIHAEVLARWRHPEKGFVSPAEFIPICERNGLVSALDFYVWEKAIATLRQWIDLGLTPIPLTLNCSRVNAHNLNLTSIVRRTLQKYNVPTSLISFEITETAYLDEPRTLTRVVEELKNEGFDVLMDDFGSGYSSLNTLEGISFDILKMDKDFLEKSLETIRGERILTALIKMMNSLDMPMVAEGVETAMQVEVLREIGCAYAQGYYYYRPMPVEEFRKTILEAQV